jgi:phosphate uptake regulator
MYVTSEAIAKMPSRIYQAYRGDYQELAETLIRQDDEVDVLFRQLLFGLSCI